MNSYDRFLTDFKEVFAKEQDTAQIEREALIAYDLQDTEQVAELFFGTSGYIKPEQAAAITRAVLNKNGTALLAVMTPLITASITRLAEYQLENE